MTEAQAKAQLATDASTYSWPRNVRGDLDRMFDLEFTQLADVDAAYACVRDNCKIIYPGVS